MYKKLTNHKFSGITLTVAAISLIAATKTSAQISLNGQLRLRAEVRQGFGNLISEDAVPASFISQRSRLTFGYKWDRLTFGAAVQDVRVWGQDASTISNNDGNRLMLHEGWAELTLTNKADTSIRFRLLDNLSFKIGRQELVYDDARLIGNLDWLQQGRRFDMALLKAIHKGWQLEIGYAYNQNAENFTGTHYTPANIPQYIKNDQGELVLTPAGMIPLTAANGNSSIAGNPTYINPPGTNAATQNYKNFLSFYFSKKVNQTKFSCLFFKDDFARYRITTVAAGTGSVFGRTFDLKGTNDRYTFGGLFNPIIGNASSFGKIAIQGGYYKQMGEDRDGRELDAYHSTIAATYSKGKFTVGPGFDILSGNSATTPGSESKRFDPLYGTPHKFWGYMDFFYAPTGSPAAGLKNYYLKSKFTAKAFFITADLHHFDTYHSLDATSQKALGDELDLAVNYSLNKFTNIELGFSIMKATNAMPIAKGQSLAHNYDKTPQFGYLMVNIRPDFLTH